MLLLENERSFMKTTQVRVFVGFGILSIFAATIFIVNRFTFDGIELRLRHNDPVFVSKGKVIYDENCASCHGINLKGQQNWRVRKEDDKLPAPPHDETGHTWHHSGALLIELTKQGLNAIAGPDYKTDMPAYENILSDEDIVAVLSYIKSTWPEEIIKRHDRLE
mgnify:FL=1